MQRSTTARSSTGTVSGMGGGRTRKKISENKSAVVADSNGLAPVTIS